MIQCVSRVDVILFLCSALCFLFAIEAEFAFDDNEAIIKNPYVNDEISVIQLFRTDFWGTELSSKSSHKSFRPLTVLTFRFLKVLNKGILYPRTFHCANIILHGLICVLLNRCLSIICTRLQRNKCIIPLHEIPFMTSLLFAVHPIHSEAVRFSL
ncbi:transmembrane and TPR repeat-containing protein 4-like protein [Leptotrombidium deliense]|uniref:Transmembrane and TPR repeat-containing protein 4-like protein n=1 Tax=Leptotrombidium deliense TaxID=299467 RepID=A0A443SDL7_9ACAR|nr:transmembrane and TPR repeat-containing protein 4-like protein [Leptotrombidium deliense]